MRHTEELITLIFFLEMEPIISKLNRIIIDAEVSNMHKYDHGAKGTTIRCYNESSHLMGEKSTTSNEIEVQLDQIKQMDVGNYLEEWIY